MFFGTLLNEEGSRMDIFQVIIEDHKKFLDALRDMENAPDQDKSTRKQRFSVIRDELLPHMHAEECFMYSFLTNMGGDRKSVLKATEEHRAARSIIQDMETTSAFDERWLAKLHVLSEMLQHHIWNEEEVLFNEARMYIIEEKQSQEMGARFKAIEQGEMTGIYN